MKNKLYSTWFFTIMSSVTGCTEKSQVTMLDYSSSIHITLRKLIDEKSKRDQVKFTSAQLASALSMPRSVITKLIHVDESKRVMNPRIDTLLKIVDFFRQDGFDITINDLLGLHSTSVDVQIQNPLVGADLRTLSLYSFAADEDEAIGSVRIHTSHLSPNLFALEANRDIKPFFKKGSVFVVNPDEMIEDDTLVAVNVSGERDIQIKKYVIQKGGSYLESLDGNEETTIKILKNKIHILGVVVQINAET